MAQNMNESSQIKPPPPDTVDFETEPRGSSSGSPKKSGGNMLFFLFGVLIVSIAFTLYMSSSKVSIKDETKNFQGVTQTITNVQNDLKATQANLTTAMNTTTDTQNKVNGLNTTIANTSKNIDAANATAANALKTATDLANQIKSAQDVASKASSDVSRAQSDVASAKSDAASAKSAVDQLKTQLVADEKLITSQADAIKALQAANTGGTTGGGTTTPTGQVTASVDGNYFTGTTTMSVAAIPASSSGTATFTMRVDNQTGKTLSNISIALAITTVDSLGNLYTIPPTTAVTVSSGGLMMWTNQSTGIGYIWGFVNNATSLSGFSSIFGSMTVKPGINTFVQTVTISNGANPTIAMILSPVVKVISFSTN